MEIIRDKKRGCLSFIKNDNPVMELSWFFDEFVWMVKSNEPIIITKETDEVFYKNLCDLMNNNYKFYLDSKFSFKEENKLQWLSDQYVNLEDMSETDKVNRLIIEKIEDSFLIYIHNPFLSRCGIKKKNYIICFSPLGNGHMVKNVDTGANLQDDIVDLFSKTINIGDDICSCFKKKMNSRS